MSPAAIIQIVKIIAILVLGLFILSIFSSGIKKWKCDETVLFSYDVNAVLNEANVDIIALAKNKMTISVNFLDSPRYKRNHDKIVAALPFYHSADYKISLFGRDNGVIASGGFEEFLYFDETPGFQPPNSPPLRVLRLILKNGSCSELIHHAKPGQRAHALERFITRIQVSSVNPGFLTSIL